MERYNVQRRRSVAAVPDQLPRTLNQRPLSECGASAQCFIRSLARCHGQAPLHNPYATRSDKMRRRATCTVCLREHSSINIASLSQLLSLPVAIARKRSVTATSSVGLSLLGEMPWTVLNVDYAQTHKTILTCSFHVSAPSVTLIGRHMKATLTRQASTCWRKSMLKVGYTPSLSRRGIAHTPS